MRSAIAPLLFACLLLLFGCILLGEAPKAQPSEVPFPQENVTLPPEPNSTLEENESGGEVIIAKNESGKNRTVVDPFGNITPRGISAKMGEGQFRVRDLPDAKLRVYVIDAGMGDAVLVNKGEFHMLIDAGDGKKVRDYLGKLGVSRINVLVASRDDPVAIGGMGEIAAEFEVDEFWSNGLEAQSPEYSEVLQQVKARNIAVKRPEASESMNVSGLQVFALNPSAPRLKGNPDVDAVVLKLQWEKFCMLLLNPTVQEREAALLERGESLECPVATFYKHGEGRPISSLVFDNLPPKDVIISVGNNTLGLPSPTTLIKLGLKGTNIYRTDVHGTVVVAADRNGAYAIATEKAQEEEAG
jgi:competence protein ComEC